MFKTFNAEALGIRCTLSEQVELALLGGFRGLDVDMTELSAMAEAGLSFAASIFRSAKLVVASWKLPQGWNQDERGYKIHLQRLAQLAGISQALGCSRAVTSLEPACDELPLHENFEHHRRRLGPIADILKKHDCRLGLEFIGPSSARQGKAYEFIHSIQGAVQLAEAIGAGNVGIVLDSFHWYTFGGTLEQIRKLRARQVVAVHVSDAPKDVPRDAQQVQNRALPLATGVIDLAGFLRALQEIGYDGPVTPEPFDRQLFTLGREQAVRAASQSLNSLWHEAGLA